MSNLEIKIDASVVKEKLDYLSKLEEKDYLADLMKFQLIAPIAIIFLYFIANCIVILLPTFNNPDALNETKKLIIVEFFSFSFNTTIVFFLFTISHLFLSNPRKNRPKIYDYEENSLKLKINEPGGLSVITLFIVFLFTLFRVADILTTHWPVVNKLYLSIISGFFLLFSAILYYLNYSFYFAYLQSLLSNEKNNI